MSDAEPITLRLLAITAITGTLRGATDRHLRSGLILILQQVQRGELPRNSDVAIAARRAQALALRLSLRGYERLPQSSSGDPDHHITRTLSEFIHAALRERRFESLDRSTQASVLKQMEGTLLQPESPDGTAHARQRAVRRLAEDWTLAEALAQVRDATHWPRFERLMREGDRSDDGHVVTPAWWDAFRAFMADEIRRDMRLATILTQRGLAEILGRQNDLNTVLADMSNGQENWFKTIAPALAALRTGPEHLKQNLERFDQIADEIARTGSLIQRAEQAGRLGRLHSEAGRSAEALAAATEAVACYRELVSKTREAFLPDLARSLNSLGGLVAEAEALAATAEALAATAEAVGFYRELVVKNRDAFLPDLARSLNRLGGGFSGAGRDEEALAANAEAVGLFRDLVVKHRDGFLPELASSLNDLGRRLSGAGRGAEALVAGAEVVGLYRELVVTNRDDFLPALAASLNTLGERLSSAGRDEEALDDEVEAVGLYRELVVKNRDDFLPELARSLNNLVRRLSGAGRRGEALIAAAEAVAFYRDLVAKNRDAFLPDLARSLYDLARRLSGAGRDEEALAGNAESVGLYRELVAESRDTFLPELAVSLNNLASRLSNAGRRDEALAASDEAVDLGKELVGANRAAHGATLARACGSRGHALRALQRLDEALVSFSEGIETLTPLMAKHGEALTGLYDALVNELIVTTEAAGRPQEAAALRAQLHRKPHG